MTDALSLMVSCCSWHVIVVDGQDVAALRNAFSTAEGVTGRPTAILAKSFKGAGLGKISDAENWHGKPLGDIAAGVIAALEEQIRATGVAAAGDQALAPRVPGDALVPIDAAGSAIRMGDKPGYTIGQMVRIYMVGWILEVRGG